MQTEGPAALVEEYLFPPVEISGSLEQTELETVECQYKGNEKTLPLPHLMP